MAGKRLIDGMRAAAYAVVAALPVVATPAPATSAPASDWVSTDFADVRLVSAVAATGEASAVPIGLEFRLAEGWKVYWRSPGDAGYPPRIDWAGSRNLADVAWRWPVPQRISIFGLETFGYGNGVVLPLSASVSEPGRPLALRAMVDALACSDICVPLTASLSLDLPAGAAGPTPYTQLIDRWRARVPSDMPGVGLEVVSATAVGAPVAHSVAVEIVSARPLQTLDGFPEAEGRFGFGRPDVTLRDGGSRARLLFPASVPEGGRLAGLPLTLTLVDGDRFVERTVTVAAAAGGGGGFDTATLLAMLGFAFLGGLILNLMPCVLPVLSLKLLGVVGYGGAARDEIRRGFLASAAGIVVSFLALAGIAVGLKSAGVAVGWGIQFQQPVFLLVMIALLLGFAANLWGLFEVPLPRALADLGTRAGDAGAKRGTLAGHFLTGAFATLLATPCSAPFLGTALGFALARGPAEILSIFAAMGVGLATPYLAVAAVPRIAAGLPRPGRWMLHLRRGLGVALAGTAVWLGTVVVAQTLPAGGPTVATDGAPGEQRPGAAVTWATFEPARLSALVADGRIVVVDVTADWCLTCKVNKALVLDTDPVAARLAGGGIVTMRADWTLPDPVISDYLAGFGRYGIPFNAVYGPGAPAGIALPELLTADAVMEAIDRASGQATAALGAERR